MKRIAAGWARGIALVGFLGTAGASWACSIALWHHAVPSWNQSGVPLNARVSVLVARVPYASFTWVREGADGSEEAVSFIPYWHWRPGGVGTHDNLELVPDEPLAANSRYRVDMLYGGVHPVTSFTTGEAEDVSPPAAPTVTVGEVVPYVPREEARGAECYVGMGFARLTARSEGAETYLLREGETLLAAGLPAEMSLAFECPAAARRVEATLTAVDVAGNMSEPVPVTFEQRCVREARQGGCSSTGGAGGLMLAAVLAWVVPWRRRRAAEAPPPRS